MYQINEDNSINVTRGDVVAFSVTAENNGTAYVFQPDDIVRISVYGKKNAENVVLRKDFYVKETTEKVDILLTEDDTKIGEVISKPTDYWYEIELNPVTNPQTIIGYDDDGAKVFKLFPEGDDTADIVPEDIPVVDSEFSTESNRPVENAVITLKFKELMQSINHIAGMITGKNIIPITQEKWDELKAKGTWQENTAYVIIDPNDTTDEDFSTVIEELNQLVNQVNETANNALDISQSALDTANSSAKTVTYQVSVPYTAWTEDAVNGGYTCAVTVAEILTTDNPIADVILGIDRDANVLYLESWSKVTRIVTSENTVTLYANNGVPATSFTMQLKVVR